MAGVDGYSTVLRWEGIAKADVTPRLRHNGREAEEEVGIEADHANELIRQKMTKLNESYIWRRGVRERLTGPDPIGQLHDVAEARWTQAQHTRLNKKTGESTPRATPSNGAHVAEFVLQLDPAFTGPAWSQYEEFFDEGAEGYLADLEQRVLYFNNELAQARVRGDVGEALEIAELDAEGAAVELAEGRENVPRWRETIAERREATTLLQEAMVAKVHEWMDVDGTKSNLVSEHYHNDETSRHVQIFAVPLGPERDLLGGVTERKLSLKNILVGEVASKSEARDRYAARHDEMRLHLNEVAQ